MTRYSFKTRGIALKAIVLGLCPFSTRNLCRMLAFYRRASVPNAVLSFKYCSTLFDIYIFIFSAIEQQVAELTHAVQTISNTTMNSSTTASLAAAAVDMADKSLGIIDV